MIYLLCIKITVLLLQLIINIYLMNLFSKSDKEGKGQEGVKDSLESKFQYSSSIKQITSYMF